MDKKNTKVDLIHDWFLSYSIGWSEKVTIKLVNYITKKIR